MQSLKSRIADAKHIDGVIFMGYGGSSVACETGVFAYRGIEIRIPRQPSRFPPERVASEYACMSGVTVAEVCDEINELILEGVITA